MTEEKKFPKKGPYCRYDSSLDWEGAVGRLGIFLPTARGYVNYNLVHSVHKGKNCDTWRLGKAYALDDGLENEWELTPAGAEWDMALRLSGRPDFIGGYAHGDEAFTHFSAELDGSAVDIRTLDSLTPFEELCITVDSVGYDPADSQTQALLHRKEYRIHKKKVILHQRVEWLNDYTLGSSYMAMMPPLKGLTDYFHTDADPVPKEAITHYGSVAGAREAVVYGASSGIRFSMSVPQYPRLEGGSRFLLTDNHGGRYNKMYFVICNGAQVARGEVWETTTEYQITCEQL